MEMLSAFNSFCCFILTYCFFFLLYLRIKIRIYHGCFTKSADGTNQIILAGERCLCLTAKPFWKFPEDIKVVGFKTRSQTKREQQRVTKEAFDEHFANKERIHRWITAPDSDVYVIKPTDRFYVI